MNIASRMLQNESINVPIIVSEQYVNDFLEKFKDLELNSISFVDLARDIIERLPKNMNYLEFMNFMADYCASKISYHSDYNKLASHICIQKLHLTTHDDIHKVANILYNNKDVHQEHAPIISHRLNELIMKHGDKINSVLDFNRDFKFDYFGMKTLEKAYLMRINTKNSKIIIERPQHMFMRVALGIHDDDLEAAFETYHFMTDKYFTHATPTLFNAGTNHPQMSSCFLLHCGDSMESIMKTQTEMAMISKNSGGIGVHITGVRSKGSLIRKCNGVSDGIIPLCIYTNKLARYVNQGGKRGGAAACFLEPWHADIYDFCELRIPNTGNDDNRARDLFLALWVNDIFMKRAKNNEMWSLMCPDECPGLNTSYGKEFEELYTKYEKEKKYKKRVKARELFEHILTCQLSSGMPYVCFKDNVNNQSNQQNLGTICSSNLCAEICEYSDENETAVCNLASICLPRFIEDGKYNFDMLQKITRICVRNLNKVIDTNFYPTPKTKVSNMRHRPIGLGCQGLCDVYNILGMPFESEEAQTLNKKIFETIYYAAIDESCKLAQKYGHYESFPGSPFSEGKLQFHLWGKQVEDLETKDDHDWNKLIDDVKQFGTRNSLLTALMPTASTSQIMKCSECFEPIMSNIFTRSTHAGEFVVINENLIKALEKHNLWDSDMRHHILDSKGSIQNIDEIPQDIKDIYKTAFELPLKSIISQSADRGPFIDQSQSMNLFLEEQDRTKLRSALYYGWERGLKTGMYYLRTCPAVDALKFGLDMKKKKKNMIVEDEKKEETFDGPVCRMEKGCIMCGS
jgi:ribonucleoside-diphosphate reductase alpha chain